MSEQLKDALLTTDGLIELLKSQEGTTFEATLSLGLGLRATHWMEWWKHRLYDEGIDSVRVRRSARNLRECYPNCTWRVSSI